MSWENIEALYEISDEDETYNELCANARAADFYFCAVDGVSVLQKKRTLLQIVPKAFFDANERVPECPLFVDHIVDGAMVALLGNDVDGYQDNLYVVRDNVKSVSAKMKSAGFVESKKLLELLAEEVYS